MPKNDLVPCFLPGSAHNSKPDFFEVRETVRLWKKEGKGYFNRNDFGPGHVFLMTGPPEVAETPWDALLRRYDVRGASVKIDEPCDKRIGMVSRFVMGESYAVAAVNAWA